MFKLGDRVITTNKVSSSIDVGFTGTIVDEGELIVSVEFDRKIENGHSCGGNCEYGYGWNVLKKYLKLLKTEEEEEEEEVEVEYKVGDTVLIKDWDSMAKEFGLDCAGDIDASPYFIQAMRKYCGSLLEITNIYEEYDSEIRYELDENGRYAFSDWMFEKVRIFPDGKIVADELYDPVERPEHYNQYKIEVIEIIEDATKGLEGIEAVCTGNALKYLLRFQYKDGKKDVRKAIWYLKRLLENMKEGNNENN